MKLRMLLLVSLILLATFTFSAPRPASASCVILDVPIGAVGTFSFTAGHFYTEYHYDASGNLVSQFSFGPVPFTGSITGGPFPYRVVITDDSVDCGGGPAVTFFNPGDKSISRLAGDRLAIYCNPDGNPQNIAIWGINNAGKGSPLIQLSYADLVAAGTGGLTKNLGANGVLYAGVASDGKTFWFAWQGGPYNATGKGDFAKTITCDGFKK